MSEQNIRGPWQWRGRHLIDGTGRTVLKTEPSNAMPDELAAIAAVPELLARVESMSNLLDNEGYDIGDSEALLARIRAATWLPPVDTRPPAA